MKNFVSQYGYIKPNSICKQSENGILFSVEYFYLLQETGNKGDSFFHIWHLRHLLETNMGANNGTYRTLPNDPNPRFSLDNMVAVSGFARKTKSKHLLEGLPLFRHYSLRPDNFIYLLYCKYPLIGFWFLWITSIAMIVSCARTDNGTSGKLLSYVKYKGANMKLTWKVCQQFMSLSMVEYFQTYFPEVDHPINEEVRKIKWG